MNKPNFQISLKLLTHWQEKAWNPIPKVQKLEGKNPHNFRWIYKYPIIKMPLMAVGPSINVFF